MGGQPDKSRVQRRRQEEPALGLPKWLDGEWRPSDSSLSSAAPSLWGTECPQRVWTELGGWGGLVFGDLQAEGRCLAAEKHMSCLHEEGQGWEESRLGWHSSCGTSSPSPRPSAPARG